MSTAALDSKQTKKTGTYEVPRPAGVCAATGRPIAPGEKFIAAVRETPTGLERLDVSPEAWPNFERANLPVIRGSSTQIQRRAFFKIPVGVPPEVARAPLAAPPSLTFPPCLFNLLVLHLS